MFFWSAFSRIRTEYGKIRTRKTPNTGTYLVVVFTNLPTGFGKVCFNSILGGNIKLYLNIKHFIVLVFIIRNRNYSCIFCYVNMCKVLRNKRLKVNIFNLNNIFYIQVVPTGVRLDPTQNLTVNWIIKQ